MRVVFFLALAVLCNVAVCWPPTLKTICKAFSQSPQDTTTPTAAVQPDHEQEKASAAKTGGQPPLDKEAEAHGNAMFLGACS